MMQFLANGICNGAIFALVAMGFGLIYTTTGVFHLALGATYTLSAYFLFGLLINLKMPMLMSSCVAIMAAAIVGISIEWLVYRPLKRHNATSTVMMISSLGVYTVIVNFLVIICGNESVILHSGTVATIDFHGITLTQIQIAQVIVAVLVIVLYQLFLRYTHLGRICRAVADDSILASILGVKVEGTRLVVFAAGSFLAAIGAVLVAFDVGMDPSMGFPAVLVAAVACIVGGLHRFTAPALGGFLLGMIQSLVVWRTSTKWENAVTFAILIAFLSLRPQGLLGMRKRIEER
ncbi:MAG: branched-chain amino acid ABC transporter permease [Candidatus Saccharibacteria bacterium]|nr:branched-chain amino acid ABC transporter permease [Candidatus Saccharibacteria bacterium]